MGVEVTLPFVLGREGRRATVWEEWAGERGHFAAVVAGMFSAGLWSVVGC